MCAYYRRNYGRRTYRRRGVRRGYPGGRLSAYQYKKYMGGRGRRTGNMKRLLGQRHVGPSTDPNQIYRVVGDKVDSVLIAQNAFESTAAQSLAISIDFLNGFWTSANFAQAISNRFASIRVKGFSMSRTIFGFKNMEAEPGAPNDQSIDLLWRCDQDIPYGAPAGMTASQMLTQQDVRHRLTSIELGGFKPFTLEIKIFAKRGQSFVIDTASNPGAAGNQDYWDASFIMSGQTGMSNPTAGGTSIQYRDVYEMLYDGLEAKY